jgi:rod shape determining protein RodA
LGFRHIVRALNACGVLALLDFHRLGSAFHLDEGWRGALLRTDWISPLIIFVISAFGCAVIYSSASNSVTPYWSQQMVYLGAGWLVYAVVGMLDYERIRRYASWVYFAGVALLIPVAIAALIKHDLGSIVRSVNGARRWIDVGPIKIQPSEFAKVTTLVMLAFVMSGVRAWDFASVRRGWFARASGSSSLFAAYGWVTALPQIRVAAVAALPIALIFIQPDLKSCIVYLPMLAALLYVSRISLRYFAAIGAAVLLIGAVIGADMVGYARHLRSYSDTDVVAELQETTGKKYSFARAVYETDPYEKKTLFFVLKDYQRERIMSFINPELIDPKGSGTTWNVQQAIIAAGRGGLTGTGWNQGSQAKLGYLPELAAHNDFVFSVFAEEFGFVGGACLLAAYAILIGLALRTAAAARDRFGALLCVGAAAVLTVHVVVNIGMNIGLMPVSGLPLPFLSYGGSFVLSCFLLLGLVQSVHRYSRELPPRAGSRTDISTNALKDMRKTAATSA